MHFGKYLHSHLFGVFKLLLLKGLNRIFLNNYFGSLEKVHIPSSKTLKFLV